MMLLGRSTRVGRYTQGNLLVCAEQVVSVGFQPPYGLGTRQSPATYIITSINVAPRRRYMFRLDQIRVEEDAAPSQRANVERPHE